jgi:hypothetical protein
MNERRKIEERLKKKEQEIQGLEDQIREAKIYIQALQDVLKFMPRDAEVGARPETTLRPGSTVAKAREIILSLGHPSHVTELLKQLGTEVTRESRAGLSGSLSAYVRRGEIFTRPAPNTFGLLELGHGDGGAVAGDSVPPADFGELDTVQHR